MAETSKYTADLPSESGYYWVTRIDLDFGVIAHVVKDEITPGIFITLFGERTYILEEFCDLGSQPLWCGPIQEPERKNNDALHP